MKVSRNAAHVLGLTIGIAWLAVCISATFWMLESALNYGIAVYGLVYPMVIALCIVAGFSGRAVLSKLFSGLIEIKQENNTTGYVAANQYMLVARQIVVAAPLIHLCAAGIANADLSIVRAIPTHQFTPPSSGRTAEAIPALTETAETIESQAA